MTRKLKINQIIYYGLPGLPLAMLGLPLFIYLPSFYNQELGLSLSIVGFVLLLARSFDVITDPLIGFFNDRYPQFKPLTWRRKSFILAGVPLLLLGLNFLLKPTGEVTASYLFIWSFITYLGWTLINIPWLAMGAEMSQDYHVKSDLASSREIFSAIGTVVVISIPVVLSLSSDIKATMLVLANILTFLIPLALLPLFFKITLNSKLPVNARVSIKPVSMFKLFTEENFQILKNPAIKKLLPAYFINSIANALPATLFILYVSYVLQMPEKVGILLISYFLSAILGIPFWLYLAKKTDKHTSWRFALYGSISSFVWVPFIGQGDFIAFLVVCIASGLFLGADVVMPSSIQADISQKLASEEAEFQQHLSKTNEVKTQTNSNSTALLFGMWGMLTKLSLALAIGIAFPLLDFAGLQIKASEMNLQSNTGSLTLILLYAIIPILLKIWVIMKMRHFEFDQQYFDSNITTPDNIKSTQGKTHENSDSKITGRPLPISPSYKRMQ